MHAWTVIWAGTCLLRKHAFTVCPWRVARSLASGGHWEKASEFFEQMQGQGFKPDAITFSGLISAFERGGQWRRALKAFEQMQAQGCHPDAAVFNSLMEVLWQSGVLLAHAKALQLWTIANRNGHFRCGTRRWCGALFGLGCGCAVAQARQGCTLLLHPGAVTPKHTCVCGALASGSRWRPSLWAAQSVSQSAPPVGTPVSHCMPHDATRSSSCACCHAHPARLLTCLPRCRPRGSPRIYTNSKQDVNVLQYSTVAFTCGAAVVTVIRWVLELKWVACAGRGRGQLEPACLGGSVPQAVSSGRKDSSCSGARDALCPTLCLSSYAHHDDDDGPDRTRPPALGTRAPCGPRSKLIKDGPAFLRDKVVFMVHKSKQNRSEQPSGRIFEAVSTLLSGNGSPFSMQLFDQTITLEAAAAPLAAWLRSPALVEYIHVQQSQAQKRTSLDIMLSEDVAIAARCIEAFNADRKSVV